MIVVGLDVGRNNAVAAALDRFPTNPRRYFADHRQDFKRIKPDKEGFEYLKALSPSAIVLEPTGGHYAAIWHAFATCSGIPTHWVGHADLAHQRGSYGFTNKRDDEDAFCLALTYFDDRFIDAFGEKRYLKTPVAAIVPLREKLLQMEQLDKNKTAFANQTRQRLCYEFPEAAERQIQPSKKLGYSPFWGWLAGIYTYSRVVNDRERSIANDLGITISKFTQEHAYQIVLLEKRIKAIEQDLTLLLNAAEFQPYLQVFRRFGFGFVNQVLLLSYIYPFEKFLVDGKPWIEREQSLKPGKGLQKRNRSLRSFQAYLGLSYKLKQSGDRLSKSFLGSDLARSHLYMWAVDRVLFKEDPYPHIPTKELYANPTPHPKISGEVGELLAKKVIECIRNGVKGSDRIMRVVFRATALLFRELQKEVARDKSLG